MILVRSFPKLRMPSIPKWQKARGDAKLTESKLRKTNEQIHYLGQYLSTKSIYGEFLKSSE